MKKNNIFLAGILSVILAFSLLVISCPGEIIGNGGGGNVPQNVDLTLPAVNNVKNFEGTMVSSTQEVAGLLGGAFEAIIGAIDMDDIGNSFSLNMRSSVRSARSVETDSFSENIDETLFAGAVAKGTVTGNYTASAKNDDDFLNSNGDYLDAQFTAKVAATFTDAKNGNLTINGKINFDGNGRFNFRITSANADQAAVTVNFTLKNGYALSISNGSKGMKIQMNLNTSANKTLNVTEYDNIEDIFDIINDNITFTLSFDVYDNDGSKQNAFSKSFNSLEAFIDYLEL